MFLPREIDSSIMGRMADMNRAAEAGAYIPALSLALTIPDACGLRLYPDLDKKSGGRYAKWFDEYVARWDYVESPEEAAFWDAAGEPKPGAVYFNGSDCYQLRCVYLYEAVNAPHMEGEARRPSLQSSSASLTARAVATMSNKRPQVPYSRCSQNQAKT